MPTKIRLTHYCHLLLGEDEVSRRIYDETVPNFMWDGHLKKYYDQYLNKDSFVLECGANIGTHTVYLSKISKSVLAFEPQTFIYYQLCGNLFINDCVNVKAYNLACFDKPCKLYIKDGTPNYLMTNTAAGRSFVESPNKDFSIQAITIDSLDLENLSFVKTDCEGGDLFVLKGAKETIKKFRPIIICEIHPGLIGDFGQSVQNYLDFFEEIGYNQTNIGCGDTLLVPK